jgi:hypothetical protein
LFLAVATRFELPTINLPEGNVDQCRTAHCEGTSGVGKSRQKHKEKGRTLSVLPLMFEGYNAPL